MNAIANDWADAMLRATWQGVIAAALVWATCAAFRRRMPHAIRCGLWWLVSVRMLVALLPVIALPLLAPLPSPNPISAPLETAATPLLFPVAATPALSVPPPEPLTPVAWLFLAWALGAGLAGLLTAASLIRTYRLVKRAVPGGDADVEGIAREVASRLRLRRTSRIRITDVGREVLAFGLWRPVVLIPRDTLASSSPEELRMILAHEFAHLRRGDGWLAVVPQAARVLFFFHPAAWLAALEYDLAREADCDEIAIRASGVRSELYGRLLLKLGVRRDGDLTLCSPGVSSHFRVLRRRITMLQKLSDTVSVRPRRAAWSLVAIAAVACAAPVGLVRAQAPKSVSKAASAAAPPKKKVSPDAAVKPVAPLQSVKADSAKAANAPLRKSPQASLYAPTVKRPASPPPIDVPIPGPQATGTELRVFRLHHAKAADARVVLQRIFTPKELNVAPDVRTNTIVVRGSKAVVEQVMEVLGNLDQETPEAGDTPSIQTRVYAFRNARAADVVTIVQTTFGNRPDLRIALDTRTNSVVLTARKKDVNEIEDLMAQVDRAVQKPENPVETKIQVVGLKYANAQKLITAFEGMSKEEGIDFISVDPVSNSLVIRASEPKLKEFMTLLRTLDHPKS